MENWTDHREIIFQLQSIGIWSQLLHNMIRPKLLLFKLVVSFSWKSFFSQVNHDQVSLFNKLLFPPMGINIRLVKM